MDGVAVDEGLRIRGQQPRQRDGRVADVVDAGSGARRGRRLDANASDGPHARERAGGIVGPVVLTAPAVAGSASRNALASAEG